jgi:hypothetical protein
LRCPAWGDAAGSAPRILPRSAEPCASQVRQLATGGQRSFPGRRSVGRVSGTTTPACTSVPSSSGARSERYNGSSPVSGGSGSNGKGSGAVPARLELSGTPAMHLSRTRPVSQGSLLLARACRSPTRLVAGGRPVVWLAGACPDRPAIRGPLLSAARRATTRKAGARRASLRGQARRPPVSRNRRFVHGGIARPLRSSLRPRYGDMRQGP